MKKSKMIDELAYTLAAYYPDISDGKITPKELAEVVLSCCEEYGMLPPYNPPWLDHGSVMDCEWEPENEE